MNLGHTRTRNYTRGGTTSESHDKEEDKFRINARGDKVDVTPKPKFRYVVDIERDSSYDPHKKVKEAIVYEAESAGDAANMARDEFGPSWKVVDVSNITSMKNLLEGTDALG